LCIARTAESINQTVKMRKSYLIHQEAVDSNSNPGFRVGESVLAPNGRRIAVYALLGVTLAILMVVGLGVFPGLQIFPAAAGIGTLVLKVMDKPPAGLRIQSLTLTIESVEIHSTGGDWKTFYEGSYTVDLMKVRGVADLLNTGQIPAGNYTEIRLAISVEVPSEKFRLIHPFQIREGRTTTLIIDFDADHSVHQAGQKYMLKPVAKIIEE